MNGMAAGAITLVLGIPLAGCHPAAIVCVMGEWGNRVCSGADYKPPLPSLDVDLDGRIIQNYTHRENTRVPGEYLVALAADAEVKPIADLYGQFGIQHIRDLGIFSTGRYRLFVVRLSEDPGPMKVLELRRENAQILSVDANHVVR